MRSWLMGALVAVAATAGAQVQPIAYLPGGRVLLDAHNAYPEDGRFADRINRALATGLPLAIERKWTRADAERLQALVADAHAHGLWLRVYTLNGHEPSEGAGWTASYNFGSLTAVTTRWQAAAEAGVDFIATGQYDAFASWRRRAATSSRPWAGVPP